MRLKDKTALISGAGRNNGRAIALTFAREGADLVLIARQSKDELNAVAKQCEELGARTLPLLADVGKPEEVERVVKLALERFGKVDVLVNVVGVRPHKPYWEYSYDEWQQIFAINLHSTFYFAKALGPKMIERGKGGSIIALGGMNALGALPLATAVTASKHGQYGLIKSLALELAPHGIRANLVALSNLDSERRNPEWYKGTENSPKKRAMPMGRKGTHQEVANTVLFLASDESSYITGDAICCAGGRQL